MKSYFKNGNAEDPEVRAFRDAIKLSAKAAEHVCEYFAQRNEGRSAVEARSLQATLPAEVVQEVDPLCELVDLLVAAREGHEIR